jgi:hypothetical protein
MARELALIALLLAGCSKGRDEAPAGATTGGDVAVKGAAPLASTSFFRVDATPLAPCAAGATCEAKLVLTALGDYHVNGEYPTKFVADAAGDVTVEGQGTFKVDSEKRGTMTVRFTPAKPGPAKLTGTFKLSVCTEENCEIEAPKISLDVTSS